MAQKIIANLILIFVLAVLEISFASGLPGLAQNVDLLIVALIFVLILSGWRLALLWALTAGLIIDFYSFTPLGMNILGLAAAMVACQFLLNNFFTNRSLYSYIVLTAAATVVYDAVIIAGNLANNFFVQKDTILDFGLIFWLNKISGVGINIAIAAVGFYFLNIITKRVRPVFLFRKN